MDLVVIHYWKVRFRKSDDNKWRMLVSDSNACSGVRLLRMVESTRSAIVLAGTSRPEELGGKCSSVKYSSALDPEYQGDNL